MSKLYTLAKRRAETGIVHWSNPHYPYGSICGTSSDKRGIQVTHAQEGVTCLKCIRYLP